MKKQDLITTAKSLTKLLDLDPPINTSQDESNIIKEIRDCVCFIFPDDDFPDDVKDTLKVIIRPRDIELMHNATDAVVKKLDESLTSKDVSQAADRLVDLGIGVPQEEEKEEEEQVKEKPKSTKEEKPKQNEKENLIGHIDNATELKDLKNLCKTYEEFTSLRGKLSSYLVFDDLKTAMFTELDQYDPAKPKKGRGYRKRDKSKAAIFINEIFFKEKPFTYKSGIDLLLEMKVTDSPHSAQDTIMRCTRILKALGLIKKTKSGKFIKIYKNIEFYTEEELKEKYPNLF